MRTLVSFASSAGLALVLAACSSSNATNATASTNGVNDVRKACDIRATWLHASSGACSDCYSYATTPRCDCTDLPYAGSCSAQERTKLDEPSCAGVDACVRVCATTECACTDACYAGKDACRTAAAAVDGCVASICDEHCR